MIHYTPPQAGDVSRAGPISLDHLMFLGATRKSPDFFFFWNHVTPLKKPSGRKKVRT